MVFENRNIEKLYTSLCFLWVVDVLHKVSFKFELLEYKYMNLVST